MTEHYLTEERRMIQDAARQFTMNEVLPVANELDPVKGEIPMDLRQKMADMGYFGIRMPEEYGGLGLGVFEYALIAEELARGWMSVASIIARASSMMGVGGWSLERRQELTRKAAQGEYLSAVALSEPNVGSDLRAVSCKAVLDGDEWVITGNKYWCTFADGADYINLLARFDGAEAEAAGHKGTAQFIIEKPRGELPEGCQGAPIPKIGYFGWRTWELAFDGCRLHGGYRLGERPAAMFKR
jgi:acyl-CoA dehydrogenase